jgi:NodT family efflux transporter outer membrane factor (OMF) lipoprotein
MRSFAAALVAATALSACAVGPDFKTPTAPATDRYTPRTLAPTATTDVHGGETQTFVAGQQLPTQWWALFGSTRLDQLVQNAFAANPDVHAAQASLRAAFEAYAAERSALFPALNGNAGAQREKTYTPLLNAAGQEESLPGIFNLFNASVEISYTLDVFGGIRRGLEAEQAAYQQQRFQLQATYLTLAANVVTGSIREASLRTQIQATQEVIDTLSRQYDLTQKQFAIGNVARTDVYQAQSNLETERATLPGLQAQLSTIEDQLAAYLGQLPSQNQPGLFDLAELKLPGDLPLTLPSALVRQRPDIRSAEEQLHQASAEVGVATAAMLPNITLSGDYGVQNRHAGDLFTANLWSIAGGIAQPLFRGGQLNAERKAAIARYDAAVANYQKTVIAAFQNVADTLYALDDDAQVLQSRFLASDAAEKALHLTEQSYQVGGTSFVSLLTVQQQYQQAKVALAQAQGTRFADTAALFQALGGDWSQAVPGTTQAAAAGSSAVPRS